MRGEDLASAYESIGGDTEHRLRTLLDISNDLSRRLELPVLLRRVVEVAVDLLGARYGALGVIGPDYHLEQFIHV